MYGMPEENCKRVPTTETATCIQFRLFALAVKEKLVFPFNSSSVLTCDAGVDEQQSESLSKRSWSVRREKLSRK